MDFSILEIISSVDMKTKMYRVLPRVILPKVRLLLSIKATLFIHIAWSMKLAGHHFFAVYL